MEKELNNITGTDKKLNILLLNAKSGSFHKTMKQQKILRVYITIITVLHITQKQQSIGVTRIVVKENTLKEKIKIKIP